MEELLKKLYNTDNKLGLILLESKEFADNNSEQELSNYIDREIAGYKVEDGLPEYRKIKGEIVGDIRDAYGNIVRSHYPLDFSALSEKVGIDLSVAYLPDGISFIETMLNGLTGFTGLRPIPKQLVKMLDETFNYNNPDLHLTAAYHKIPIPGIEYILTRVRQHLIQSFQKLNKNAPKPNSEIQIKQDVAPDNLGAKQRRIFVSYAWENDDHNSQVVSFVDFLRKRGFDASMDRKRSQEQTATNFNEMMIDGIQNSDKVVVVLSSGYKQKADKFEGGVWQEFSMIIEEMKTKKNKYIFVFFGSDERESITPAAILGTDVLDLKKDQDTDFNTLFSKIKEENIIEFSEVGESEVQIKRTEIKPFRL